MSCWRLEMKGYIVPRKYKPFEDHTSDRIFSMIRSKTARALALESEYLSTDFKLYLVGLGRISNRGHSPFARGELSTIMGTVERNLRKLISKLSKDGLLSPESTTRCLVYPVEVILQKTQRGSNLCPEHGTHRSWSNESKSWLEDYATSVPASSANVDISLDIEELNGPFQIFESQLTGTISS